MNEWKKVLYVLAGFLTCFYLPVENLRFTNAVFEALALVKWYAREHVILCLVPAFFIAGAISVFVSQASVMKYFGAKANKFLSYSVASISGTILAVCSCTVLPLFSGIYKRGSGLGPAIAFLYSGPAINVLAIILTARILGWELGLARAIGAVVFSVVIGLLMHFIFLKEERARHADGNFNVGEVKETRPLGKTILYFASMIAFLVFANWGKPLEGDHGVWALIYQYKWWISGISLIALAVMIIKW
ncbi:MAG TPA: permease, partial [Candidatus Omnitrophota bacterium]|nr:permease [Candidatus Omnitrophota bacterium]